MEDPAHLFVIPHQKLHFCFFFFSDIAFWDAFGLSVGVLPCTYVVHKKPFTYGTVFSPCQKGLFQLGLLWASSVQGCPSAQAPSHFCCFLLFAMENWGGGAGSQD